LDILWTISKFVGEHPMVQPLLTDVTNMAPLFAIKIFIYLLIVVIVSAVVSHRMAGPIFKFEKSAKTLASGDLTHRISLRKGDHLTDLQDSFNIMAESLQSAMAGDKAIVEGSAEELKKIADREKLQNYVDFVEWPGHNMLSSFIYIADVCTIPQPAIESNNTTIPHKLFEYMSKGKKILVSDAKPLKRVIRETQSGTYFESFNTTDYSQKFIELLKSSENFSNNGIKWVREKYNWSQDS